MPCATLSTAQIADLSTAERDLASLSGALAMLQDVLARLAESGLPGAKAAKRNIGRAVCQVHEAADALNDDVRTARQQLPAGEDFEAPF